MLNIMKLPDQGVVNDVDDRVYLNFKHGKLQESVLIFRLSNTCFCSLFWSKLKQHYKSHHTSTQTVIENINYNRKGRELFSN